MTLTFLTRHHETAKVADAPAPADPVAAGDTGLVPPVVVAPQGEPSSPAARQPERRDARTGRYGRLGALAVGVAAIVTALQVFAAAPARRAGVVTRPTPAFTQLYFPTAAHLPASERIPGTGVIGQALDVPFVLSDQGARPERVLWGIYYVEGRSSDLLRWGSVRLPSGSDTTLVVHPVLQGTPGRGDIVIEAISAGQAVETIDFGITTTAG